jgi:hypothetical protein
MVATLDYCVLKVFIESESHESYGAWHSFVSNVTISNFFPEIINPNNSTSDPAFIYPE